jgi:hypothetical protein
MDSELARLLSTAKTNQKILGTGFSNKVISKQWKNQTVAIKLATFNNPRVREEFFREETNYK